MPQERIVQGGGVDAEVVLVPQWLESKLLGPRVRG